MNTGKGNNDMTFPIESLLTECAWRLRSYLGGPSQDPEHVGWRCDAEMCPAAEWLNEELSTGAVEIYDDMLFIGLQLYALPSFLTNFIQVVDTKMFADPALRHPLDLVGDHVSQAEALAALALAQGLAGQLCAEPLLLPGPVCAYPDCNKAGATQWLYGFVAIAQPQEDRRPAREECLEFAGSLCDEHAPALVIPPAAWWSSLDQVTQTIVDREAVLA